MRHLALLTSAGIAFVALASAQTAPADPVIPDFPTTAATFDSTKVIAAFTLEEIGAILTRAGYENKAMSGSYNYLEVVAKDGYKFEISLGDCPEAEPQRCTSINLRSYPFNEAPRVTLKAVNEWNTKAWGARGMLFKDGTSGVAMNIGADGGVTEAWLNYQVTTFTYWLTSFGNFQAGTTPAATP